MKVLVFEHCMQVTGHRIPYASLTANSFDSHEVIVALPEVLSSEDSVRQYFPEPMKTVFFKTRMHPRPLAMAMEARRCLLKLVRHLQPDLVAIPTADGLALVLGGYGMLGLGRSLNSAKVDACLMKGGGATPAQSGVKKHFANFKWWLTQKGPWQRLMLIDPRAWAGLPQSRQSGIHLCPDPVPQHTSCSKIGARKSLGVPADGRLIVSVGRQDKRKGVDQLLNAFVQTDLQPNDRLLLVGKVAPEIDPYLQSSITKQGFEERIISINRFVSEEEFAMAIDAADMVAVPYRSADQPSGIVCRTLAWNRPILATNRGWLKWAVAVLGAGFVGNPEDPTSFARTIEASLKEVDQFSLTDTGKEFVQFNSEQSYQQTWRDGVAEKNPVSKSNPMPFLQQLTKQFNERV